jgi:hypothetical protein
VDFPFKASHPESLFVLIDITRGVQKRGSSTPYRMEKYTLVGIEIKDSAGDKDQADNEVSL